MDGQLDELAFYDLSSGGLTGRDIANHNSYSHVTLGYADAANITNPIDLQSDVTLQVTSGSATQSGVISQTAGSLGITKTGTGTLALNAANTYSGTTVIDAGTLLASNSTGFATGLGTVIVNDGGTLGGDGTVNFVTVNSGGTLAPGTSAGALSVGNSVVFEDGSTLEIEIGGLTAGIDFDQLIVGTDATINSGATLDVSLIDAFTPAMDDQFLILSAGDSLSGVFGNVANGARLDTTSGVGSFLVSYDSVDDTIVLSDFQAIADLPGDGNGDGMVDGLDYLLWAAHFGDDPAQDPPGSPSNGDYNDDNVVNGLDYLVWAGNFGAGTTTSVPEPGTLAMLLVGCMAISLRRHCGE